MEVKCPWFSSVQISSMRREHVIQDYVERRNDKFPIVKCISHNRRNCQENTENDGPFHDVSALLPIDQKISYHRYPVNNSQCELVKSVSHQGKLNHIIQNSR